MLCKLEKFLVGTFPHSENCEELLFYTFLENKLVNVFVFTQCLINVWLPFQLLTLRNSKLQLHRKLFWTLHCGLLSSTKCGAFGFIQPYEQWTTSIQLIYLGTGNIQISQFNSLFYTVIKKDRIHRI